MIQIRIENDEVVIVGHAGAALHGQSVPCEAVTVLVNTVVASICELTDDHPAYIMESGNFKLERKGLSDNAKLLVRSFLVGLCMVAEAYPEWINLQNNSTIA
nr:MAG TPA: cysteine protease [Caudoviricetes sp.]